MAAPAQALQVLHIQCRTAKADRLDVVYHGGGCMLALPRTFLTQRVAAQLGLAQLPPSIGGVEAAGFTVTVAGIVIVVDHALVLIAVRAVTQGGTAWVPAWCLWFSWHGVTSFCRTAAAACI